MTTIERAYLDGFIKAAVEAGDVAASMKRPVFHNPVTQVNTPMHPQPPAPAPDLYSYIKGNEGFRPTNYLDSLGKPTIGYGSRNTNWLAKGHITEPEAATELTNHVRSVTGDLQSNIGTNRFNNLPPSAKVGLQDLGYQTGSISNWPRLLQTLTTNQSPNFPGAAHEIENSLVNSQTPDRNQSRIQLMLDAANQ